MSTVKVLVARAQMRARCDHQVKSVLSKPNASPNGTGHGLGGVHIAATVISAMVGAGIYTAPGLLVRQGAPALAIILLFASAGVVSFLGALVFAELAAAHPGNGGPYHYLRNRLGPGWGFVYNWSRFWVMQCGALAILALIATRFLATSLGVEGSRWEAVAALGLLAGSAALNARGLRVGANVQAGLTAIKLVTLLLLTGAILLATAPSEPASRPQADLPGGLGSWILLVVFAFGGWTQVTFLAGEVKPSILPRAIAVAIAVVTGVYVVSLGAIFLASPDASGEILAAEVMGSAYGDWTRRLVALVISVTVLGTLHTMTLTGPRLYAAAAEAGAWWRPFAKRNAHGVPGSAIWLQAEWAGLLIAFSFLARDAFTALIAGIGTAIWLFHAAVAIAWFRGARPQQGFRMRFAPVVPLLFLVAASGVVVLAFYQDMRLIRSGDFDSLNTVWALFVIVLGLAVYGWTNRRKAHRDRSPEENPDAP